MFKLKREAWPMSLIAIGVVLALSLSLSLAVPKAGAVTIAELMVQIQALQAQLVQLQAAQTGGAATATACTFTQSLYLGVSNAQVKCLQQYLNGAGYTVSASGAGSVGNETNYYGTRTQSAVAKWQAANNVSPAVGYFGPISRAKYSAVAGGTVVTPVVPITPVLPVANIAKLSSDNPASMHITNNASNFKMLEVVFEGSGAVNSLTVKRFNQTNTGFGKVSDFGNGIYLYKDGVKIADKKPFGGTDNAVVTFSNLNLNVPFKLAVMTDFDGTSGNVAKIELSGVYAGLPLSSNEFTFANMNSGTYTIKKTGTLDDIAIGQENALISVFSLTASSTEGVVIKHLELYNAGHNILSNVKISDNSEIWSGSIRDNKIIFDLNSLIKENRTRKFEVRADVSGNVNVNNEIKIRLQNQYDIIAVGDEYGFGAIMKDGPTVFNNNTDQDKILVSSGDLTIKTESDLDPQALLWSDTSKKVLGFTVKNVSESFNITEISLALTDPNDVVKTLSVYQGNIKLDQQPADAAVVFDTSFTLSGEKTFTVLVDLNVQDEVASSTFSVNLTKVKATGVSSNKDRTFTVSSVIGKTQYVYPTLVKVETSFVGTFAPSSARKLLSLKFISSDAKFATSTPHIIKVNYELFGIVASTSPVAWSVKLDSDVVSSGVLTSNSDQILITTNKEIELGAKELTLYMNTLGFNTTGLRGVSLSVDDTNDVLRWTGKDKDGDYLSTPFSSVTDLTKGLPVEVVDILTSSN